MNSVIGLSLANVQRLLETHKEITIEQQKEYITYLTRYNLVRDREVLRKMRRKTGKERAEDYSIIEVIGEDYADDPNTFVQDISKILLKTDSNIEVAQAVLQADSPEEAALKLIQNEEQMEKLLALIQKQKQEG